MASRTRSNTKPMSEQQFQDALLSRLENIETKLSKLDILENQFALFTTTVTKLEAELSVVKKENINLKNNIIQLEKLSWANEQYSRRDCLEFTGIPDNILDKDIEKNIIKILGQIDVKVHSDDIVAAHRISRNNKKVIVKFVNRKSCHLINKNKKKLNKKYQQSNNNASTFKPELLNFPADTKIFINDSLSKYNKILWNNCRNLRVNKLIHSFWFSNGSLRIQAVENGEINVIYHGSDLELLFPDFVFDFTYN